MSEEEDYAEPGQRRDGLSFWGLLFHVLIVVATVGWLAWVLSTTRLEDAR